MHQRTDTRLVVTDVRRTSSTREQERNGIVAWLRLTFNDGVRVDGVALRRTVDGQFTLSYPRRRDSAGRRHDIVRPRTEADRRDIQEQVFLLLDIDNSRIQ